MLNILQQIAGDYAKSGVHRPAAESEQFNLLQQCAVDAGFVSHLHGESVPKLGLGGPGTLASAPHGALVYQYDRLESLTLPYLALPPEEFEHRINSLGETNPDHYESKKNKILSKLECLSSGTFHPYGLAQ